MAKRKQEDPLEELERAYAHWQDLYDHGGMAVHPFKMQDEFPALPVLRHEKNLVVFVGPAI